MTTALPDFSRCRVLIVGDVMLDRYWQGPVLRISPEAPVPVVRVEQDEYRAGGAGNVAVNLAALGAQVDLIGLTGADNEAALLRNRLESAGVRCHFIVVPSSKTISKLRVLSRHQQLIRLDFEDGFTGAPMIEIRRVAMQLMATAQVLVLSDYAKGALGDAALLVEAARERAIPVVVDPKGSDFSRYSGATVITPNRSEFESVVGRCTDDHTMRTRGAALREQLDLEALLITRSELGMMLLARGRDPLDLPAQAREVYDVTGAGDTVVALLAAGLACGQDVARATALANLAAGVVVGKLGTATVSLSELAAAMSEH